MKLNVGDQFSFRAGNRVRYGMDMSYHRGLPPDTTFTVKEVWEDRGTCVLIAYGYGVVEQGAAAYGNGPIIANISDVMLVSNPKGDDRPGELEWND